MKISARCLAGALLTVLPLSANAQAARPASYLYVWTGDADTTQSDFLAVIDVRPGSNTFARVVNTVPVNAVKTGPHHTEHQVESDNILFANGFGAGRTFRFDLSKGDTPRLLGSFTEQAGYSFPHSFVQLGNGHMLSTFQGRTGRNVPPGGLVEMDRSGTLIRSGSARVASVDSTQLRPYSLAVLPAIDRVVSTSTDMIEDYGAHLQVWRLSDLKLLQTIELPKGAALHAMNMAEDHHRFPGEPRVLADGRTVLLATFTCGFYRVTNINKPMPKVEFLRSFPGKDCAVPVLLGNRWIQTVPDEHALVSLDVSNSAKPREVGRVMFDSTFKPHWLALDAGGSRLVVNDGKDRVMLVKLDARSGRLAIDSTFRDAAATVPGVSFKRAAWPHGATGDARPHGSVFSRQ